MAGPELVLQAPQARLMAAAVLIPISEQSVAQLSDTLLLPAAPHEPRHHQRMEAVHA